MSSAYSDAMGSDGIDFNELRRKVAEAKRLADKPAATGSGEPFPICTECGKKVTVSWESHADECTPPASQPTVTLDRETFDKVCAVMAKSGMLGNYAIYSNEDGDSHHHGPKRAREYHDKQLALEQEFRDALALLRAAEQK